jgi:heat shock protein HslJ
MKNTFLLIALTFLYIISICAAAVLAQGPDRLSTQLWTPVRINGRAADIKNGRFEINRGRTRFTANAGCNNISGNVTERGSNIRFTNIVSTRKFCGERGVMKNENDFTKALGSVTRSVVQGGTLTLYARNREVLRFKAAADQNELPPVKTPVRLETRKWMLAAIAGRAVAGSDAFINFDPEKKSAGGNTSCNVFGGNYTVSGTRLKITGVISTMRACIEDERMVTEREFLDGLRDTDRYEIKANKLYLYKGRRLLLSFDAAAK